MTTTTHRIHHTPRPTTTDRHEQTRAERTLVTTSAGRRTLSGLRLATGFIFLWAFLDKTFGLGFSTPSAGAWIHGGKPSQGFLMSDAVSGPLKGFFASIASPTTDVLFMAGMLGIGVAVMAGVGLRISAVVGTVLMLLMYLAEWPFAANAASTNPLVDYHIVYALALIVVATLSGGDTWGFGAWWKRLPVVRKAPWLI
ncbi:DoxX family protein [Curtobacterium pusillum]|uniref:DoxX family protein n=1 Tax=Curtobacterium pusillum TaxID=69373 RepID=UPI0021B63421|nr:DoxX family protein [Curtobacterium pusillum]